MRSILPKPSKKKNEEMQGNESAKQKTNSSQVDDIQFEEVSSSNTVNNSEEIIIDEVIQEDEITEEESIEDVIYDESVDEHLDSSEVVISEEILSDEEQVIEEESFIDEEMIDDEFVDDEIIDDDVIIEKPNEPASDESVDSHFRGNSSDQLFEDKAQNDVTQEIAKIVSNAVEIDSNAKKYVIYIDSDNIDFMEGLSIIDRRKVVNKIIREKNKERINIETLEQRKIFIKHLIVATLTFIVAFPILFFMVNKSMEVTMYNYEIARENFAKLYKQRGKIQLNIPESAEKFKY